MAMYHCIKCNLLMCDPELYFRAEGEGMTSGKTKIHCPDCKSNKTRTGIFGDKTLMVSYCCDGCGLLFGKEELEVK